MSFSKVFKSAIAPAAGALIGGAFGGAGGAGLGAQIGSMLGGSDDGELTALQAYNMQKADSINFWNMQNAYNDPSAQMARLAKAGLNPFMVYQGNVTGNSSSSIDTPTLQPHYAQPLSTRLTKAIQNLNLRSMQADTKGKEVDTEMRELNLAIKKAQLARLTTGRLVDDFQTKADKSLQLKIAKMTTAERRAYFNSLPDHFLLLNNEKEQPVYEKYTGKIKKSVGRALKSPWATAVDFVFS